MVNAKAGGGSATLSTAYAAARLSFAILRGLSVSRDSHVIQHTRSGRWAQLGVKVEARSAERGSYAFYWIIFAQLRSVPLSSASVDGQPSRLAMVDKTPIDLLLHRIIFFWPLQGEPDVVECAYMKTKDCDTRYFANPLVFGKNGVEKRLSYGTLSAAEQQLLRAAIPELIKNIQTGEKFMHK